MNDSVDQAFTSLSKKPLTLTDEGLQPALGNDVTELSIKCIRFMHVLQIIWTESDWLCLNEYKPELLLFFRVSVELAVSINQNLKKSKVHFSPLWKTAANGRKKSSVAVTLSCLLSNGYSQVRGSGLF